MPVSTEIFSEKNIMVHRFSDYVSLPLILKTLESSITHPQYRPGMNMLWYCETGTTIDLDTNDLHAASDVARSLFEQNVKRYKDALVAADDLPYGLFRVYEGWSNDRASVDIQVFRELEDALAWIEG